jgi:hypothetical protein
MSVIRSVPFDPDSNRESVPTDWVAVWEAVAVCALDDVAVPNPTSTFPPAVDDPVESQPVIARRAIPTTSAERTEVLRVDLIMLETTVMDGIKLVSGGPMGRTGGVSSHRVQFQTPVHFPSTTPPFTGIARIWLSTSLKMTNISKPQVI